MNSFLGIKNVIFHMFEYFYLASKIKIEIIEAKHRTFFLTDWTLLGYKFQKTFKMFRRS